MRAYLRTQTPDKQLFDALLMVLSWWEPARLAGVVNTRMTPEDAGAVAESLRYLASLIEAQGGVSP